VSDVVPKGVFQVVLPVKEIDRAKSRLDLPPAERCRLALAFVLDTVDAILGCDLVGDLVVATRDHHVAELVTQRGARAVSPPPTDGLNADVTWTLAGLDGRRPTAVLMSDLPALSPGELTEALACAHRRATTCHVEDLHDGGTTMLAARDPQIVPRFGGASAARHAAAGTTAIGQDLVGLRCDVDDLETLRHATHLGVGPHTTTAHHHRKGDSR
jgi:2-phospho-L-lactate guanylyltransferase